MESIHRQLKNHPVMIAEYKDRPHVIEAVLGISGGIIKVLEGKLKSEVNCLPSTRGDINTRSAREWLRWFNEEIVPEAKRLGYNNWYDYGNVPVDEKTDVRLNVVRFLIWPTEVQGEPPWPVDPIESYYSEVDQFLNNNDPDNFIITEWFRWEEYRTLQKRLFSEQTFQVQLLRMMKSDKRKKLYSEQQKEVAQEYLNKNVEKFKRKYKNDKKPFVVSELLPHVKKIYPWLPDNEIISDGQLRQSLDWP